MGVAVTEGQGQAVQRHAVGGREQPPERHRIDSGAVGQQVEDATAVVVEDHDGEGREGFAIADDQTGHVVHDREVTRQGRRRTGTGQGDADRRGGEPVDPRRPAVAEDAQVRAGGHDLVEVADRQGGGDDEGAVGGHGGRDVTRHPELRRRRRPVQRRVDRR